MTLNYPPAPVAFFALNNRSGAPQLRLYAGGERYALGTTFASAETPEAGDQGTSRVLLFGAGDNTLVAMQATGIYRTTDLGVSWTLVHTLTSADASACKSGLFVVYLNGVATLCGFYRDTSGNFRGVTSTDGIAWTNVILSGVTSGTDEAPHSCIIYENKICCVQQVQNRVLIYDPGSSTITSIPNSSIPASSGTSSIGLTVCNGNLYVAYRDTSNFLCLAKMTAGTFTNKFTTAVSVTSGSGKWGVWTFTASNELPFDGFNAASIDEEINVVAHRASGGWGYYVFDYNATLDTFVLSDVTASSIPALMLTAGTSSSVALYLDSNTSPGYVRDMFIFFKDGGSNWNMYRASSTSGGRMGKWSDLAANVPNGVFTDNNDALPSATNVCGSYSAALLRPEIISQTYVSGGIRFTFILNTPEFEGQLVKVIGFWGTKYLTLPNGLIATLSDTSHGVITGGVIYNLVADASTQYQVTWLAETDGFSNFDPYKFILVAFAQ